MAGLALIGMKAILPRRLMQASGTSCFTLSTIPSLVACDRVSEQLGELREQVFPSKPTDPVAAAIYEFNKVKGSGDASKMCNNAKLVVSALKNSEFEEDPEKIEEWNDRRETVCEVANLFAP